MKIWLPTIRAGSGADRFTVRLARALQSRGVEAEITWFPHWYELVPDLLRSTRPPPRTSLVHANTWSGFAFKQRGLPLVLTEHHCVLDPDYLPQAGIARQLYYRTWIRYCVSRSLAAADVVTAVSRSTAEALRRGTGVSAIVIANWVDTANFRPADGERQPGPFRLLFVGNLSSRKGADLLPPLMTLLGPTFELTIVGGLRPGMRDVTAPNIKTVRDLSDGELVRAYQSCDVVVVPSRLEGFSYVALEAAACGKPVVASRGSALPEVVRDGVTGLLCPVDDVAAFASAVRTLSAEPALARSMGQAGREMAVRVFTEEAAVAAYGNLYRNAKSGRVISS
jgi:glycosyltransferase involved in cell wall biosynthesis